MSPHEMARHRHWDQGLNQWLPRPGKPPGVLKPFDERGGAWQSEVVLQQHIIRQGDTPAMIEKFNVTVDIYDGECRDFGECCVLRMDGFSKLKKTPVHEGKLNKSEASESIYGKN
jgi:hypothetical protein